MILSVTLKKTKGRKRSVSVAVLPKLVSQAAWRATESRCLAPVVKRPASYSLWCWAPSFCWCRPGRWQRWLKESRPYNPCGRRKLNTPCHCKHLKNEPEDGRLVAWDQLQLSLELENGVWIWRGKETWPQSLSVLHQQLKELSFLFTQIHHKHTRLIHFWLHAWLSGHVQMFDDFFTSWLTRLLKIIL